MIRSIAISLSLLLLSACTTLRTHDSSAPLNKAEVSRLFVGNTVESYNLNTRLNSFTYYHPDGQVLQERLWSRRVGQWSIQDDGKICLSMTKKPPKCRHIILAGGRYFKVRDAEKGPAEKIVRYRYFVNGNALLDQ